MERQQTRFKKILRIQQEKKLIWFQLQSGQIRNSSSGSQSSSSKSQSSSSSSQNMFSADISEAEITCEKHLLQIMLLKFFKQKEMKHLMTPIEILQIEGNNVVSFPLGSVLIKNQSDQIYLDEIRNQVDYFYFFSCIFDILIELFSYDIYHTDINLRNIIAIDSSFPNQKLYKLTDYGDAYYLGEDQKSKLFKKSITVLHYKQEKNNVKKKQLKQFKIDQNQIHSHMLQQCINLTNHPILVKKIIKSLEFTKQVAKMIQLFQEPSKLAQKIAKIQLLKENKNKINQILNNYRQNKTNSYEY